MPRWIHLIGMAKAKEAEARTAPHPAGGRAVAGVVRADELYTAAEVRRRLRWRDHSFRQAKRKGLRVVTFGRTKYVLGSDVLAFFEQLAAQQNGEPGE